MASKRPADPDLAHVLRAVRERQGRSQEALAHDAGLTVAAVARIERGEVNPGWTTVLSVVDALGISLAEFGGEFDARRKRHR
jgi:transcriptional regulator with XRE-family HTH domain